MPNNSYNYSVSLIRRNNEVWTIDPSEVATRALYQELLTQSPGSSYLATKTEGELSYCIFLSGEVCHSDICGWIITINSWRITDLDMHLHLSQKVWRRLAQTPVADTGGRLRHLLLRLIEFQDLIPNSYPVLIDRNVDYQYEIRKFTSQRQLASVTEKVRGQSFAAMSSVEEDKSLFTYFVECYTKHFTDFSGRARRREYWGTVLFNCIFFFLFSSILGGLIQGTQGSRAILSLTPFLLLLLVLSIPGCAVAVRRLHDTGRSGFRLLVSLIPYVGPFVVLYWLCLDSQPEENEYGLNPKRKS